MIKNNTIIDLLGHFHIAKLSTTNSYLSVSSLNRDHVQNGAYRIKLFFDSNENIINSILIPLIVDNKMYEATSIIYQKKENKLLAYFFIKWRPREDSNLRHPP